MRNLVILLLLLPVLLMVPACRNDDGPTAPQVPTDESGNEPPIDDPTDPPATTGNIAVHWTFDSTPTTTVAMVKVFLSPGGSTVESSRGSTAIFEDLEPRFYTVSVEAFDQRGGLTHSGRVSRVEVVAGQEKSVDVKLETMLPEAPESIKVAGPYTTRIALSWPEVPNARSYKVYYSTSRTGSYEYRATTNKPLWEDRGVMRAKYHYYRVAAVAPAGEGPKSEAVRGYIRGWRYEDIGYHNSDRGIGLRYDLYVYGYRSAVRAAAIYGVYRDDRGTLRYTPGSGVAGAAAYSTPYVPPSEATAWHGAGLEIYATTWHPDYRNNRYDQYIAVAVYASATIKDLNDPKHCQSRLYGIQWSQNTYGEPVMRITDEVPAEEAAAILSSLDLNPPRGELAAAQCGRNDPGTEVQEDAGSDPATNY